MSSALETLLEAARYIELQEERERQTSTSSSASSQSTSPYSNSRYHHQSNQNYVSHSLVSTPPASPLSDGPRNHTDYGSSNGSTIVRNGKFHQFKHTQKKKIQTSFYSYCSQTSATYTNHIKTNTTINLMPCLAILLYKSTKRKIKTKTSIHKNEAEIIQNMSSMMSWCSFSLSCLGCFFF